MSTGLCARDTSMDPPLRLSQPPQDIETEDGRIRNQEASAKIRDAWIYKQIRTRQEEFTQYKEARILCGTWNVNAKKADIEGVQLSLEHWLGHGVQCDIVAVGFQEIVDLNAVNVAVDNKSLKTSQYWIERIRGTLGADFMMVAERHLVGLLVCVFVKRVHMQRVKYVHVDSVGVGVMGIAGNKGGVSVRLQFYDSTLCIICSHLAAHRENVVGRNADYANILNKTRFDIGLEAVQEVIRSGSLHQWATGTSSVGVLDHDHVFWIGDLNYRIDESIKTEDCLYRAVKGDLQPLIVMDQLNIERARGRVFQGFEEGNITFKPTYKYQPYTDDYETRPEKKLRAPAWCDRILWSSQNPSHMKQLDYSCCSSLKISDHKPVMSTFVAVIKDIVQAKRDAIHQEIIMVIDKYENQSMPIVRLDKLMLDFGEVRYDSKLTLPITITNTGQVLAQFRFVPKLEEVEICKPWIKVSPAYGMLIPGEVTTLEISITLDNATARALNAGEGILNDILVLRLENGRDFYITINGTYARSCFGMSLDELVMYSVPVRTVPLDPAKRLELGIGNSPASLCIPKELWRIVDAIYGRGLQERDLFSVPGLEKEVREIRECLDTGAPFGPFNIHSMTETLVSFLAGLSTPVIPPTLFPTLEVDNTNIIAWSRKLLEELPPISYNVFIYMMSFFREVLLYKDANRVTAAKLARICCECMVLGFSFKTSNEETKNSITRRAGMQIIMDNFITTDSI
uniref:Rho-GAP domain-containing protein n=1 Tax=Leptocylindrus danicus TaxID=163516 RepID=A0A7S2LT51_9STRA|mmetsp:Transcript_9109/g.13601  ORF Transcript_9109/g.13601 Transcript_9109/m.13601 type:complete len:739 (+) Transcript_9109:215-2431(+)